MLTGLMKLGPSCVQARSYGEVKGDNKLHTEPCKLGVKLCKFPAITNQTNEH